MKNSMNNNAPADVVGTGSRGWPLALHVAACAMVRQMATGHKRRGADQRAARYDARFDDATVWDVLADVYTEYAPRLFAHPSRQYEPTSDACRLFVGMAKQRLSERTKGMKDTVTGKHQPRRGSARQGSMSYIAHLDADVALAEHEAHGEAVASDYDVHDATARALGRLPVDLQPTARHMLLCGSATVPDGVARATWFRRVADVRQAMKRLLPAVGIEAEERAEPRKRDTRSAGRPLVPVNGSLEPVALGRG